MATVPIPPGREIRYDTGDLPALAALPGTLGRPRPDLGREVRSVAWQGYVIVFRYVGPRLQIVRIIEGHGLCTTRKPPWLAPTDRPCLSTISAAMPGSPSAPAARASRAYAFTASDCMAPEPKIFTATARSARR